MGPFRVALSFEGQATDSGTQPFEGLAALPNSQRKGMIAFAGILAVSSDFEDRCYGLWAFDQSCRISLADHFGLISAS